MNEPQRLLDDGAISSALRRDLEHARAEDPGYDVSVGVARFESILATAPAADGATAAADTVAAAKSSAPWWIAGGGAIAIAAVAVAWSIGRDPAASTTRPEAAAPSVAVEPRELPVAPTPAPEEPARLSEPAEPAPPPTAPDDAAQPTERKRSTAKPPAPAPDEAAPTPDNDELAREMAATAAAKRALGSDPALALRLVAKADRDFATGVYAEDREGIAVLALAKLGRNDEARARGQAYLAAHPKGSYADRIRSVLGNL